MAFQTVDWPEGLQVCPEALTGRIVCGDSRTALREVPEGCVGLVVTSPPYGVGKQYDDPVLAHDGLLELIRAVVVECYRVLEPGERIAINVANLWRKPWVPFSAHVAELLCELGFVLRGEIVWVKTSEAARSSCRWGSWASATNPCLRDTTERIVVASKGSLGRMPDKRTRKVLGLPWEDTILAEDFREWSVDCWRMRPAVATRVGHPAPFPVELPRRLIKFYTFRGDVVLDPFAGSGTSCVAAVQTDRRWLGIEQDPGYVELARTHIEKQTLPLALDWQLDQGVG